MQEKTTQDVDHHSRPRVLVADDQPEFVNNVLSLLKEPFEVVGTASNGLEAIEAANRLAPDVIVLDVEMPELNGIDAADRLRDQGSSAKLVFCSNHDEHEIIEACLSAGALAFISKSQLVADLIPTLKHVLSTEALACH